MRRIGRKLLAGMVGVCLIVAAPLAVEAAHADDRWEYPIIAGSTVEVPGGRMCTVGAVLQSAGMFSRLTAYQRGVRYLVIAKHCVNEVGSAIRFRDEQIGEVSFMSPDRDIALVKVDPVMRRQPVCSGASQLHRCFISEDSTPRASGKILLRANNGVGVIPVAGSGDPRGDEIFCTSGSVTGVNCGWRLAAGDHDGVFPPGENVARSMRNQSVVMGDSGGPVAGRDGTLYGIITTRGNGQYEGLMSYVPMSKVFDTIGPYYALAPAT